MLMRVGFFLLLWSQLARAHYLLYHPQKLLACFVGLVPPRCWATLNQLLWGYFLLKSPIANLSFSIFLTSIFSRYLRIGNSWRLINLFSWYGFQAFYPLFLCELDPRGWYGITTLGDFACISSPKYATNTKPNLITYISKYCVVFNWVCS